MVDTTFYGIDSIFEVLGGGARLYLSYVGIFAQKDRFETECTDTTMYTADIALFGTLCLGVFSIIYKMVIGVANAVTYFFYAQGIQELTFYNIGTIFSDPVLAEDENA